MRGEAELARQGAISQEEALDTAYGYYMEGLAEDVAAITGWQAEKLKGWAKPLTMVTKPLEEVLMTRKSGSTYPSQASWWLAERLDSLADDMQGWADGLPTS
eukprot:10922653-Lingulodinium_polyedra.AAC.1